MWSYDEKFEFAITAYADDLCTVKNEVLYVERVRDLLSALTQARRGTFSFENGHCLSDETSFTQCAFSATDSSGAPRNLTFRSQHSCHVRQYAFLRC